MATATATHGHQRTAHARRPDQHRRFSAVVLATVVGLAVVTTVILGSDSSVGASTRKQTSGHTTRPVTHKHRAGRTNRFPVVANDVVRGVAFAPQATTTPLAPGTLVPSAQDQPDPAVISGHGRYYLYTSGETQPIVNVPVASSTDFAHWGPVTDALPKLPTWAVPGFTWAPEVHRFGASYMLYFSAIVKGTSPALECIGSASSKSPVGPFTPSARPFICQSQLGGTIDPRVFTDSDGKNWMLFKSDQNLDGATVPTRIWSQQLTANGRGVTGVPADILGPDEPWEGTIVEAPDMVRVNGTYWLFYSANWFNQPEYAIGAARCTGPSGPCDEVSTTPLLASNLQGLGPGEESLLSGPAGVWMLYTPRKSLAPKPDIPRRPVYIVRLGFTPRTPYLASEAIPPDLQTTTDASARS